MWKRAFVGLWKIFAYIGIIRATYLSWPATAKPPSAAFSTFSRAALFLFLYSSSSCTLIVGPAQSLPLPCHTPPGSPHRSARQAGASEKVLIFIISPDHCTRLSHLAPVCWASTAGCDSTRSPPGSPAPLTGRWTLERLKASFPLLLDRYGPGRGRLIQMLQQGGGEGRRGGGGAFRMCVSLYSLMHIYKTDEVYFNNTLLTISRRVELSQVF